MFNRIFVIHSNNWNHLTLFTYAKLIYLKLFNCEYLQNMFPNHKFDI